MKRLLMITLAAALVLSACGKDEESDDRATTTTAEATTTSEPDVNAAIEAFCSSADAYVDALDKYTGLFSGDTPDVTVGQVQDGMSELAAQRSTVEQSASDLDAAVKAVDAQEADEQGSTTTVAGASTTTTLLAEQTADELVAQITKAEDDFDSAVSGIDASTPVAEAEVEFTSAAYALEVSWSILLTEAGCVEDAGAVQQVQKFVASLQTDLQTLGFYEGDIDGIYGPQTTAAVTAFQKSVGLPETGLPDPATQKALSEKLAADAAVSTAALQGLLAGLGLYTGPIDGQWSPALEAAVKELQAALDVPQTGVMDQATLRAYANRKAGLEELVAYEQRMATSTTTAAPTTAAPTTAAPTTAAPTTAAPTTTTTSTTTTTTTTTTTQP
jgi:peptidoglycan hydrolase-like protein with peptidoglycan-binding domain